MHTKLLPIVFGVVFALTLFFAVAAGAQEERTITDGVGVQAVEVQQQQVPNDQQQQQVVAVQQQQVQSDQQQVGTQAHKSARVDVQVLDKNNEDTGDGFEARNGADGDVNINRGPGKFRLDIDVTNARYDITVFECKDNNPNNGGCRDPQFVEEFDDDRDWRTPFFDIDRNIFRLDYTTERINNDGRHNRGRHNRDRHNRDRHNRGRGGGNRVDITQETTTPDRTTTNTANANTADAALDNTTADDANLNADFENRPDSGSFRCDLFLRTVRDDQGALRTQYRDGRGNDEEIVQRFEQCLSEDVLADTIPNRNLPFTGGPLLPFGGGLVLFLVAAAVLAGRIIRR